MKSSISLMIRSSFVLVIFSIILSLTGCEDEEEVPLLPIIDFRATNEGDFEFNSDKTELDVKEGVVVVFSFDITTQAGFRSLSITGLTAPQVFDADDPGIEGGETELTIDDVPLVFSGNSQLTISFTVTDELDRSITRRLTVNITSEDSRSIPGIILETPVPNDPSTAADERTSDTWFSSNLGATITSANIVSGNAQSQDVDFGFYYQDNKAFLSSPESFDVRQYDLSPSGQNWSTLHNTTFRKVPVTESTFFQLNTAFDVENAYSNGEDVNEDGSISGISAGDFIGFRTDGDKEGGVQFGIIFIKSIEVDSNGEGTIQFDARLQ